MRITMLSASFVFVAALAPHRAEATPLKAALGPEGGLSASMRSQIGGAAAKAETSRGRWLDDGMHTTRSAYIMGAHRAEGSVTATSATFDEHSKGRYLPAQRWEQKAETTVHNRTEITAKGKVTTATIANSHVQTLDDNGYHGYSNPKTTTTVRTQAETVTSHLRGFVKVRHAVTSEQVTKPDGVPEGTSSSVNHLIVGSKEFRLPSFKRSQKN